MLKVKFKLNYYMAFNGGFGDLDYRWLFKYHDTTIAAEDFTISPDFWNDNKLFLIVISDSTTKITY